MLFSGSSLMSTAGSTSSAVKADTSIGSIAHMSPTCKNLEPTACVCRCSAFHPASICPSAMSCSRKRSPLRFSKAMRLQSHVDGQHLPRAVAPTCSSFCALPAMQIARRRHRQAHFPGLRRPNSNGASGASSAFRLFRPAVHRRLQPVDVVLDIVDAPLKGEQLVLGGRVLAIVHPVRDRL